MTRDDIIDELKRESGGSFSVMYRALRRVSDRTSQRLKIGPVILSKSEVIREIREILRKKTS